MSKEANHPNQSTLMDRRHHPVRPGFGGAISVFSVPIGHRPAVTFLCALISLNFSVVGLIVAADAVEFESHILPILEKNCFECHSSRIKKPKGGVSFDSAGALAEVAADPEWNAVLELLKLPAGDGDLMPPADDGGPLKQDEIALLEKWVSEGAGIGGFVAHRHSDEKLKSGLGGKDIATDIAAAAAEIDRLVETGLEKRGLKRNPEIDEATFLRRAYLELAGRNPTVIEAETFLKSSTPGKRASLVESLSNSDAYVSHHLNYWTKVLRVQSKQDGNEKEAWLGYLRESIASNKPYDKWVREMLTSEGRVWENPAIGFYLRDNKNRLAGYEAMTSVFLGTDIGCAQCHDHPSEPLSQLDYFKMYGFYSASHPYNGTQDRFLTMDDKAFMETYHQRQDEARTKRLTLRDREQQIVLLGYLAGADLKQKITSRPETTGSRVPKSYRYDDIEHNAYLPPEPIFGEAPELAKVGQKPMVVFTEWATGPQNLKFTHVIANRIWLKIMGAPVLGPPTDLLTLEDAKNADLADHLAELMLACAYDLKRFQAILMNTRTYQSETIPAETIGADFAFAGPVLRRLSAEQIWDSLLTLIREEVDPPSVAPQPDFSYSVALRNATSPDEYWSLVGRELDRQLETHTGYFGARGDTIRSEVKTARQGFDGDFLVRASELNSPAPDGHFLQVFGQGKRAVIEDQWDAATIPQTLMLLNGNLHDEIAQPGSAISHVLGNMEDSAATIERIYLATLARIPDAEELVLARRVTADGSRESFFRLLWILLNTTEYVLQP